MGDHSESIQIDFDPKVIRYAQLVEEALAQGNFGGAAYSRQYRSVVFYHTPEQKEIAEKICPSVEPVGVFTRAEDYHQKYYLQQSNVVRDFYAMFPGDPAFTDATATMRANAIVGGFLSFARAGGGAAAAIGSERFYGQKPAATGGSGSAGLRHTLTRTFTEDSYPF